MSEADTSELQLVAEKERLQAVDFFPVSLRHFQQRRPTQELLQRLSSDTGEDVA